MYQIQSVSLLEQMKVIQTAVQMLKSSWQVPPGQTQSTTKTKSNYSTLIVVVKKDGSLRLYCYYRLLNLDQ